MTVTEQLRKHLLAKLTYMSINVLALHTGVDAGVLSRFINDKRTINGRTFDRLCRYLDLELERVD